MALNDDNEVAMEDLVTDDQLMASFGVAKVSDQSLLAEDVVVFRADDLLQNPVFARHVKTMKPPSRFLFFSKAVAPPSVGASPPLGGDAEWQPLCSGNRLAKVTTWMNEHKEYVHSYLDSESEIMEDGSLFARITIGIFNQMHPDRKFHVVEDPVEFLHKSLSMEIGGVRYIKFAASLYKEHMVEGESYDVLVVTYDGTRYGQFMLDMENIEDGGTPLEDIAVVDPSDPRCIFALSVWFKADYLKLAYNDDKNTFSLLDASTQEVRLHYVENRHIFAKIGAVRSDMINIAKAHPRALAMEFKDGEEVYHVSGTILEHLITKHACRGDYPDATEVCATHIVAYSRQTPGLYQEDGKCHLSAKRLQECTLIYEAIWDQ